MTWRLAMTFGLMALLVTGSAFSAGADEPIVPEERLPEGAVPNEIVVAFSSGLTLDAELWLTERGGEVLLREPVMGWVSARFDSAAEATAALDAALARPDVRYAQRDGYVSHLFTPNDPMYGNQWGFPAISAPQAWDITTGSHDVVVAILDTGVEGTHPDLAANVCDLPHASFVPGEPPLWDGHFHGTHVGGTVAAVSDNNLGVSGASQSCLMDVKVLSQFGGGQWTWVAAGIVYAADNGADIISMSLGGGNPGALVENAVDYAYLQRDVLVIAAAGNSGCFGSDTVIWPAKFRSVVAVASVDPPNGANPSGFSSCGPAVEVAAPGASVLSTWRNGGYGYASGTSMATPHVSGVAALAKNLVPEMSAPELRCLLILTADDIGQPGWDFRTGWGRVNALKAVTLAPTLGSLPLSTPDLCGLLQP